MKTNRILIAFFFLTSFAACGTESTDSNLTPISRWALALTARLHAPQWHEPSDSCKKIALHWEAVVRQDMNMAWHFANRPELIADSTVIELTGDYVISDSLPNIFERHMARLDTAENVQENYWIDYSRQYSTQPEAWVHKPITQHSADQYVAQMGALNTALSLHRQVLAIIEARRRMAQGEGNRFGGR